MIVELGHFALALALGVSIVLAAVPLAGAQLNVRSWTAVAKPAALLMFVLVAISYACLTAAFIASDFSVKYIVDNSNSKLPLLYRISGVWAGHEGSLLFWVLLLSLWTAAVAAFSRRIPLRMSARVLGVLGCVTAGFLLLTLLASNPFERILPAAADGRDLNPLLQDPGLAFHPPMLYMGYVGFAVAFAFGIAGLLDGRIDMAWIRWARPWTNLAWAFLTLGIALGSYWAYYELGWGGWWFWDPVENASFMPWLVGTALIHSMSATEKRGLFKSWTVLLAVLAFSLSLLGTFLVRSGVITSVHAFANDPARGLYILCLLGLVIGISLVLYAWRAPQLTGKSSTGSYELLSREVMLQANNLFLLVATATIILGTLYPLALDALGLAKVSVGPPYFNSVFVPLMIPLIVLAGIGSSVRWKRDQLRRVAACLIVPVIAAVLGALAPLVLAGSYDWRAGLGACLGMWLAAASIMDLWRRAAGSRGHLRSVPLGYWGMTIAHLGVAMFVIGATAVSAYGIEKNVALAPGEKHEIGSTSFELVEVKPHEGPNYSSERGIVLVTRGSDEPLTLVTEKRTYEHQENPLTEAGIHASTTADYYVSLGEPLGGGSWSLLLQIKPLIRWIWFGALLMAAGGIIAVGDARYRVRTRQRSKQPEQIPAEKQKPAPVAEAEARA